VEGSMRNVGHIGMDENAWTGSADDPRRHRMNITKTNIAADGNSFEGHSVVYFSVWAIITRDKRSRCL